MKTFKRIALIVTLTLIWAMFIGGGLIKGYLLKPIASKNDSDAFVEALKDKIESKFVGNLAFVLIENGVVTRDYFYSVDQPIDSHSIFPVASISKWVTSFGVLKLVEQGILDLDQPVESYLTRWNLPETKFDNNKVTIRNLLSHSSGLVDDLGYDGFDLDESVQTIEESLTKASDAPYSEGIAKIGYEPDSEYKYSGAGYTILQLVIEEVTGMTFRKFMKKEVFLPLEMNNSDFLISEKNRPFLVPIYKNDSTIRAYRKFTALAAASLLTSTSDLSKFVLANISSNEVVGKNTINLMSEPQSFRNNTPMHGLGPHLYSQHDSKSKIIGHDGSGNNALNTAARINLNSKNGIIILETGNFDIASTLADEWLFWDAGIADYVVITRNIRYLATLLIIGIVLIIFSSILLNKRVSIEKN